MSVPISCFFLSVLSSYLTKWLLAVAGAPGWMLTSSILCVYCLVTCLCRCGCFLVSSKDTGHWTSVTLIHHALVFTWLHVQRLHFWGRSIQKYHFQSEHPLITSCDLFISVPHAQASAALTPSPSVFIFLHLPLFWSLLPFSCSHDHPHLDEIAYSILIVPACVHLLLPAPLSVHSRKIPHLTEHTGNLVFYATG